MFRSSGLVITTLALCFAGSAPAFPSTQGTPNGAALPRPQAVVGAVKIVTDDECVAYTQVVRAHSELDPMRAATSASYVRTEWFVGTPITLPRALEIAAKVRGVVTDVRKAYSRTLQLDSSLPAELRSQLEKLGGQPAGMPGGADAPPRSPEELLRRIGQVGPAASGAPTTTRILTSAEAAERARLVKVASDLGIVLEVSERHGEQLDSLRVPDAAAREQAARDLESDAEDWSPSEKAAATPALVLALSDPRSAVRASVAGALGAMGEPAASAIPALIALMRGVPPVRMPGPFDPAQMERAIVATAAAKSVGRLGKSAVDALLPLLKSSDAGDREWAAIALQMAGPLAADLLPTLLEVAKSADPPETRAAALRAAAAAASGESISHVREIANGWLQEASLPLRTAAVDVVAALGGSGSNVDAERVLSQLVDAPDAVTAMTSASALGVMGVPAAKAVVTRFGTAEKFSSMKPTVKPFLMMAVTRLFDDPQTHSILAPFLSGCASSGEEPFAMSSRGMLLQIATADRETEASDTDADAPGPMSPKVEKLALRFRAVRWPPSKDAGEIEELDRLQSELDELSPKERRQLVPLARQWLEAADRNERAKGVFLSASLQVASADLIAPLIEVLRNETDVIVLQGAASALSPNGKKAAEAIPLLEALAKKHAAVKSAFVFSVAAERIRQGNR